MLKELAVGDFARIFGTTTEAMPDECKSAIADLDFRYAILENREREDVFLRVLRTLDSPLEVAGRRRKERWEEGWRQNLCEFIESGYDLAALVPKFVRRNEVIRLEGNYIQPADPNFETNFVTVLRVWLFKKWFEQVAHVYEFGCGTAHNLVAFAKLAPDKTLHGLDWSSASQQIIRLLAEHHGFDISGGVFDLLSPDPSYEIAPNSGVLTVGALEQLGREYEPFVEFLLQRAPTICVHIETLYEAYDQDRLFDNVAVRYLQKRGYLQGYVSRLRQLQKEGYIKILQLQRTFGSLYHDGYSFLVWEPVR